MTYAKKLYLIAAGAVIVLSAGSAFAQNYGGPGEGRYQSSRDSDPEEAAKRKPVDDNYKRQLNDQFSASRRARRRQIVI